MGLLQKACETYDAMAYRAGEMCEGEKEPLAPVGHIMARAQIEITLNQDGEFSTARAVEKDDPKIIIPATEESAGRTSAPCAHPLSDQLGYLAPTDPKKEGLYIRQLEDWTDSPYAHPKLRPILNYIRGGTILKDLEQAGILSLSPDGKPPDEKLLVRWVVNGLGEGQSGPCWRDRRLMDSFAGYCAAKQKGPLALCMISGEMAAPASQHPKGIIPINGNAKLISANDTSGFTYRGRFSADWQAATVGYTASQKAHNALRWLIANQGAAFGGRTFLCWNPEGVKIPEVTKSMRRRGKEEPRAANPSEYKKQLREALSGWKEKLPQKAGVVITAFDAATTGRLSVTYYNELLASDFLQRLHDWEASCQWENGPYGVQCPSLYQIVSWAFGTLQDGRMKPDDRILGQQMQRLAACRVDRAAFPVDIKRALAEKASNSQAYRGKTSEETRKLQETLLFTACAVIRKYRYDCLKEEWDMALDKENTNRSYLFGRLLAIADTVERSTYTNEDARETNAMRMQKAFALRPMATWRVLEDKLEPYYRQLRFGQRQYYRNLTGEILDKLSPADNTLNQKLEDVYLLGYYHQRAYRNEKNNKPETEEEN